MAFNELDLKRIEKAAEAFMAVRRPPVQVRDQVDFEWRIDGQSVELLEVRPAWDRPTEIMRRPFAKATYVRRTNQWRVYWMRSTLKWQAYEPAVVGSVQAFFDLVDEDRLQCFFG